MPKKSSFKRRGGVSGKKVREQEQGQLKMAIRTRTVFARSVCVCVCAHVGLGERAFRRGGNT